MLINISFAGGGARGPALDRNGDVQAAIKLSRVIASSPCRRLHEETPCKIFVLNLDVNGRARPRLRNDASVEAHPRSPLARGHGRARGREAGVVRKESSRTALKRSACSSCGICRQRSKT